MTVASGWHLYWPGVGLFDLELCGFVLDYWVVQPRVGGGRYGGGGATTVLVPARQRCWVS